MAYGYEKMISCLQQSSGSFSGNFSGENPTPIMWRNLGNTYMTAISAYKNSGKTIETFNYGECEKGLFIETLREYETFKKQDGKDRF